MRVVDHVLDCLQRPIGDQTAKFLCQFCFGVLGRPGTDQRVEHLAVFGPGCARGKPRVAHQSVALHDTG